MEDYFDDEGPLWKRIFLNEFLWALLAIILVLGLAFHFATGNSPEEDGGKPKTEQK